jgi:hypothetical protein
MKKIVFFVLMILGFTAYAQTAQTTQVDFNKSNVPGVSIAITGYDVKFIQNALMHRFEKVAGLKGSNSKGFRVYLSQNFPDFGTLNYDIYTSVRKVARKDSFITVFLLVSKGNNNFVSQNIDSELTDKMMGFLTNFSSYLKEYERVQKIDLLAGNIKKLEKEYNTLVSDRDKLRKDFTNLDNKLITKEKEVSAKASELEKARADLDGLK